MLKLISPIIHLFELSTPIRDIKSYKSVELINTEALLKELSTFKAHNHELQDSSVLKQVTELASELSKLSMSSEESNMTLRDYLDNPEVSKDSKLSVIQKELQEQEKLNNINQSLIAQLGCELLKLEDVKAAIEVFKLVNVEKLTTNQLKFNYDYALALSQSEDKKDNELAIELFKELKENELDELKANMVEPNKLLSLSVAVLDKFEKYEEAQSYWSQIESGYKGDNTYEQLLLIKYAHKQYESLPKGQQFIDFVINPLQELLKSNQDFADIIEDNPNADILYLIGLGYAVNSNFLKANAYFSKAIEIYTREDILIRSQSFATYKVLSTAIQSRDQKLVDDCVTKIYPDLNFLPQELGLPILALAAEINDKDLSKTLLENGANPFYLIESLGKRTPTHIAFSNLNYTMLNNIMTNHGKEEDINHSEESSMGEELTLFNNLQFNEQSFLTQCLDYLGYSTEFNPN